MNLKKGFLSALSCMSLIGLTACQESIGERFEREAKEYTERHCPQRINPEGTVILDSMVFHNDGSNEIIYYNSIHADAEAIRQVVQNAGLIRDNLKSKIINSVDLKNVKAAGLTISYRYRTADGDSIIDFSFTQADYTK